MNHVLMSYKTFDWLLVVVHNECINAYNGTMVEMK